MEQENINIIPTLVSSLFRYSETFYNIKTSIEEDMNDSYLDQMRSSIRKSLEEVDFIKEVKGMISPRAGPKFRNKKEKGKNSEKVNLIKEQKKEKQNMWKNEAKERKKAEAEEKKLEKKEKQSRKKEEKTRVKEEKKRKKQEKKDQKSAKEKGRFPGSPEHHQIIEEFDPICNQDFYGNEVDQSASGISRQISTQDYDSVQGRVAKNTLFSR